MREIKLRPKIAQHDYETKRGHVERFLRQANKVKITIMFRGREQAHPERGRALLQRPSQALSYGVYLSPKVLSRALRMSSIMSSGSSSPMDRRKWPYLWNDAG